MVSLGFIAVPDNTGGSRLTTALPVQSQHVAAGESRGKRYSAAAALDLAAALPMALEPVLFDGPS